MHDDVVVARLAGLPEDDAACLTRHSQLDAFEQDMQTALATYVEELHEGRTHRLEALLGLRKKW